jgi:hypothetical protein
VTFDLKTENLTQYYIYESSGFLPFPILQIRLKIHVPFYHWRDLNWEDSPSPRSRCFGYLFSQSECSLDRSKVLEKFRSQHCNWQKPFTDDLINELCSLKNISNNDAKFRVTVVFKEFYCWKHALIKLE